MNSKQIFMIIKKIAKRILPTKVYNTLKKFNQKRAIYYTKSYSQEGEDMIIKRIFEGKKNGFYIDVGAYHPKRFSNTYYFYLQGWKGINIDAARESVKIFNQQRPRDINLETAVSDKKQVLKYYAFNEPALNSFSKDISRERNGLRNYKLISQDKIQTNTLEEILNKHLSPNTKIDFLSIDVEGFDYKVLLSNNWQKYRPQIVLVEDLEKSLKETINSKITIFMQKHGYELHAKTHNTIFFKRID